MLSTGESLPGEVTAVRVGIDVTLRMPDGSLRTLPWSEIHVATAGAGATRIRVSAGPADADPVDDSEFSRTPRDGDSALLLESVDAPLAISGFDRSASHDAMVQAQSTLRGHTQFLCATPCMLYAAPGTHSLHFGGDGLSEQDVAVDLEPGGTRVRLRATRALRPLGALASIVYGTPALIGGIALLGAGISGAMNGGLAAGSCSASVSSGGAHGTYSSTNNCDAGFLLGFGTGLSASGGGLLALGAYLAGTSRSGVIESRPLGSASARATRAARGLARVRLMGVGVSRAADGRGAIGSVGLAF